MTRPQIEGQLRPNRIHTIELMYVVTLGLAVSLPNRRMVIKQFAQQDWPLGKMQASEVPNRAQVSELAENAR